MTSGNLSDEPIATDNEEARQRLASLAEAFLMHNRDIHSRCDDSVIRIPGFTGFGSKESSREEKRLPFTFFVARVVMHQTPFSFH